MGLSVRGRACFTHFSHGLVKTRLDIYSLKLIISPPHADSQHVMGLPLVVSGLVRCLGILLISGKLSLKGCEAVTNRIMARTRGLVARHLSFARRV